MQKNDVVITACGLVSPLGNSLAQFEQGMFSGRSGVRSIRGELVENDFPVPYAAFIRRTELPVTDYDKDQNTEGYLKSWLMTAAATESALQGGMVSRDHPIDAIVYGTADGVSFEQVVDVLNQKKSQEFNESQYDWNRTRCESSVEVVSGILKKQGFPEISGSNRICINSACASGNNTIGIAFEGIQSGRWQRCLVGGVDARCEPSNFLNFLHLGALTTAECDPEKASRPFSKDRSGFVRGEGAAVLIMESRESAVRRGAKILCRVLGYGFTSDAYRLTDGREDAASVIQAMETAIRTAGLVPRDIQYINAHGTSTPLNDRLETFAIKKVFGENAPQIPISSLKSQIGHSTIASSALEGIACAIMLQRQKVAPTINYTGGDPECDLDYVPEGSRELSFKYVLSNSFGFGGQNACVVFGKED